MNMLAIAINVIEENALGTRIFTDVLEDALTDVVGK